MWGYGCFVKWKRMFRSNDRVMIIVIIFADKENRLITNKSTINVKRDSSSHKYMQC